MARAADPERESAPGERQSGAQASTGASPAAQKLLERRDERQRRLLVWWDYTREALFQGIELTPEQTRKVDALIEAQLSTRTQIEGLDAQIRIARSQADAERSSVLRAQRRALDAQLKERPELMEEMRTLLTEAQHPLFDMNRARLVAEGQKSRRSRKVQ